MNYAIGDVQGNLVALKELLQKIKFKTDSDKLFFLGDVVNRGKQSLKTLEFIYSLADNIQITLGNHDFHLLVCAYTDKNPNKKDTIKEILTSPNKDKLIDFLRQQPLIIKQDNNILIHAGIAPQWQISDAMTYAQEVEAELQSDNISNFLAQAYNDMPNAWDNNLTGYSRLRYIVNACMRMRFCTANGKLEFSHNNHQNTAPDGYKAWFLQKNNHQDYNIIFGHWSSLKPEHTKPNNIYPLDSACIWGGKLSAINIATKEIFSVSC